MFTLGAMTPIEWLEHNVLGFADLPESDRQAIFHFALLWSLFEGKALQTRASAHAILALVHEWAARGRLTVEPFEESLEYFRRRHFTNGQPTEHFNALCLRHNDNPELVRAVLQRANADPADCVAALLIVVYRLRNNLFHGVKWDYVLQGQLDNFVHANTALMSALTLVGSM
jgi:hypothetical protein